MRLEQRAADLLAHGLDLHAVDDLAGERVDEEVARLVLADAARAEVEQRLLLDLADRRAVVALHVVVVDLERRLGVDDRRLAESSRLRFSWRETVFCASGRTMILPSNTPRAFSSRMPL